MDLADFALLLERGFTFKLGESVCYPHYNVSRMLYVTLEKIADVLDQVTYPTNNFESSRTWSVESTHSECNKC